MEGSLLLKEQELEQEMLDGGARRFWKRVEDTVRRGQGASLSPAEKLVAAWFTPTLAAVRELQRKAANCESLQGISFWGPAIQLVDAEKIAAIALHVTISQLMANAGGMSHLSIAYEVGATVMQQAHLDEIRRQERAGVVRKGTHNYILQSCKNYVRSRFQKKIYDVAKWATNEPRVNIALGSTLVWTVQGACVYEDHDGKIQAGFRVYTKFKKHARIQKMVKLADDTITLINNANTRISLCRPRYMAMCVPPQPWVQEESTDPSRKYNTIEGGYVYIRTPLISHFKAEHKRRVAATDMAETYKCHDAVGATPLAIYKPVYEAVREVWRQGGGAMGLPPTADPPKPRPLTDEEIAVDGALKAHKRTLIDWYGKCVSLKSERESFNQAMACADWYCDFERIYFPHQMDFRGREVPIPAQLNFQGDDPKRGMLRLAHGIDPGDRGRRWLMIHAAKCYGFDKGTFDEQCEWTMDHLREILKSAKRGLDEPFWQKADKPWQFLGACHALTNPEHAAHCPVQIDATCNGLQHYAALGLDPDGAMQVNLAPSERPANLYQAVADECRRIVLSRLEEEENEVARMSLPHIDRPLVKQPVMTTNYGVTKAGMRDQITATLTRRGVEKKQAFEMAKYLADTINAAIGAVAGNASEIMQWLRDCAMAVCSDEGERWDKVANRWVETRVPSTRPVWWRNPMGMPVVQSYRAQSFYVVKTMIGDLDVDAENDDTPVRIGKQKDSFPPNFIHSLDATHNLWNARQCFDEGLAYIPIHDCFASHAASMDRLGQIVRQEFVRLHHPDRMADLARQLREYNPGVDIPDPPERRHFDLSRVLTSQFAFR